MAVCSYVVVSRYVRGRELAAPTLTGLTIDEALAKLSGKPLGTYRLSLALDSHQRHETAKKGSIISQRPSAGSNIKAGSPIRVVISDGPPLVTVPDLRGQSLERATTLLRRNNLKVGTEARMAVEGKPGGLVITTDPQGGTGVAEGTAVNVMLTAGASQSNEMPDLVGLTLAEVHDTFARRGLPDPTQVPRPMGGDSVPGQVVDQLPKPGGQLQPGTQVIVYFEPQREETPVPTATPKPEPQLPDQPEDALPLPDASMPEAGSQKPAGAESGAGVGVNATPAPNAGGDEHGATDEAGTAPAQGAADSDGQTAKPDADDSGNGPDDADAGAAAQDGGKHDAPPRDVPLPEPGQ